MLTNTLHAIKDQNKDVQNHLYDHNKFWDDMAKILKQLPSQTTPLHFSHALHQKSIAKTSQISPSTTAPAISQLPSAEVTIPDCHNPVCQHLFACKVFFIIYLIVYQLFSKIYILKKSDKNTTKVSADNKNP